MHAGRILNGVWRHVKRIGSNRCYFSYVGTYCNTMSLSSLHTTRGSVLLVHEEISYHKRVELDSGNLRLTG